MKVTASALERRSYARDQTRRSTGCATRSDLESTGGNRRCHETVECETRR